MKRKSALFWLYGGNIERLSCGVLGAYDTLSSVRLAPDFDAMIRWNLDMKVNRSV